MRIAYLIGRYPAINHGYLLEEIRNLRGAGIEIEVASIGLPDRPDESLTDAERQERDGTFYIKAVSRVAIASTLAKLALHSPAALFRGLRFACRLAPRNLRGVALHLFYFVEAALLAEWMERAGISHVHVSFSGTVAAIATRIAPITMSLGIYGFGEVFDPVGAKLAVKIEASAFVRSVSRHLSSMAMISCPPSQWPKLEYVPLGVDPQAFPPLQAQPGSGSFRMICVGRLAPEKGQRLLIAAADVLRRRGADFLLRLVGDGPDRGSLELEIASKALAGWVVLEGSVDRETLLALYARSDAFVLASLYEGIPIVLMEAMAMEIPCIAPRITGIPELIHDGVDGLLFTPADVEDLVAAILRLAASPDVRRSLGRNARECVIREYSAAPNAQRFAAVLRRRAPHLQAGPAGQGSQVAGG
jgi:glycosyltransferase involved in cell wall biosynthesis